TDDADGDKHGERCGHPGQWPELRAAQSAWWSEYRCQRNQYLDTQRIAGTEHEHDHHGGDRYEHQCGECAAFERDQQFHGGGERGEYSAGDAFPTRRSSDLTDDADGDKHGERCGHPGQWPELHAAQPAWWSEYR